MPLRVTTKEIAQLCGVSIGTVDRALNNRTGINRETRERIIAVANQLGYRPHLPARSLVTGYTMTIGVVVLNLRNPFFSQLVEVIERKAGEAGYHVYLMLSEFSKEEEEEALNCLRSLNVDGIIICPVNRGNSFTAFLRRLATPVLTVSNRVSKSWPWVGIDERSAVRESVGLVISRGYERIIYITQSRAPGLVQLLYVDEQRIQGYRDALREAGPHFSPEVLTAVDSYQLIEKKDDLLKRRTCLVCTCDEVALEVLNALKAHGLRVPEEVGLTGFDNLDILKYISPMLTTVSYPIERMGEAAFDSLLAEITGKPKGSCILSHSLIPGETV
jgi:LacI family transcriptional regulator